MRGHSAVRIAASVKSGTAIEHAVNSVVTESVNIHNHSEVIQRVNYGFSCWQAYMVAEISEIGFSNARRNRLLQGGQSCIGR